MTTFDTASSSAVAPTDSGCSTTVVDVVARALAKLGVRRSYGLPGEDHIALLEALSKVGINYYTAANESSAAIMAATDSAVSGVPGLVLLSMATGVSNAVNGILHAYMEQLPLLVVSGRWAARRQPLVVRQGFDPIEMVRPLTKWSAVIATPDDPSAIICQAIDIATSGRRGPVYLELPGEIATSECRASDDRPLQSLIRQHSELRATGTGPSPGDHQIREITQALAVAERPVLVVGGRAAAVSRETLAAFSTAFRTPVFTSPGQLGILTEADAFFAGAFLNGTPERHLLDRSDLVLAIDPEAFDFLNRDWPHEAETLSLASTPTGEWLYSYRDRLVLDPEETLRRLITEARSGSSRWIEAEIQDYRDRTRRMLVGSVDADDPSPAALTVATAVETALRAVPDDAYVAADAGFSKPLVTMLCRVGRRGRFLASNSLSTMGFGIPAALAAGLASSNPVIGFLGDGSLLMRATELVVAHSLRRPVVLVAMMDRSLSQIEVKQRRGGVATVGVELPELSCAAIGAAFGVTGSDVSRVAELHSAVEEAFTRRGCTLIGAHIGTEDFNELFELLRG